MHTLVISDSYSLTPLSGATATHISSGPPHDYTQDPLQTYTIDDQAAGFWTNQGWQQDTDANWPGGLYLNTVTSRGIVTSGQTALFTSGPIRFAGTLDEYAVFYGANEEDGPLQFLLNGAVSGPAMLQENSFQNMNQQLQPTMVEGLAAGQYTLGLRKEVNSTQGATDPANKRSYIDKLVVVSRIPQNLWALSTLP